MIGIPITSPEKYIKHDLKIVSHVLTDAIRANQYITKNMAQHAGRKACVAALKKATEGDVKFDDKGCSEKTKALKRVCSGG